MQKIKFKKNCFSIASLKKPINNKYKYYKKNKDLKQTIEKRYIILIIIVILIFVILLSKLFYVQVVKNQYYVDRVEELSKIYIDGPTAPRGRIYDRNGKIIVDNEPVKVIYYKKKNGVTTKQEISYAYELANMIDVDYKVSEDDLRKFWALNNKEEAKKSIALEEWKLFDERKLSAEAIEKLKQLRVTDEQLSKYTELDKEACYIYMLMNTGYSYDEKIIKNKDVSDKEYAKVAENIDSLNGFNVKLDWKRTYPYGTVFRSILGNISTNGIPYENKDYYLNLGYSLNDRVGISYLEYQYENFLKGTKNRYLVNEDGSYTLVDEGKRGNDIFLTIDIELQKAVEKILIDELVQTKQEENTEYYDKSFVIISNPNTGEILAMAGKQIQMTDNGYKIYDYTPGILTSPVTIGSAVKGASQIVGYTTGALQIGEVRSDDCIKIASTPLKCSWKYLGNLNDIEALKQSSNVYQFKTAINVGKGTYVYDQPLKIDENAFNIYRDTFAKFGLGVKTEIDLPIESLGYKGTSKLTGHLLDFAIGQYDTYTPIQLSQYINTIANGGSRLKPFLLKSVYDNDKNLVEETKTTVLNTLGVDSIYLNRVKEGFKAVMTGGTGYGYIDLNYNPAGKTGTSQSFIDTNGDNVVDKETITNTFVAFAPYDNPTVTFTVISPNISHNDGRTNYQSKVNKRLTTAISSKYFEIYPQ